MNVEWELSAPFGKKNRWLVKSVSITQLVEDILIRHGNFGDDNSCSIDRAYDVFDDETGTAQLACVMGDETGFCGHRLHDSLVKPLKPAV